MKKTHSAGGVVLNSRGQVLVVSQRGKSWSLPKGHVEKDEAVLAAAQREIYEESGISDLVYIKPLGSYERMRIGRNGGEIGSGADGAEFKRLTFFLFTTTQEHLEPIDPDNPEARWVSPDEVNTLLTHPKDREFFSGVLRELENVRLKQT